MTQNMDMINTINLVYYLSWILKLFVIFKIIWTHKFVCVKNIKKQNIINWLKFTGN